MINQRIKEVLDGTYENYIMPFFWLHGAGEETLRNCIAKIDECGIRAVCLEARPHPDFLGEGWWHDLDIILEEGKKRGMKVWILDDAHFPTGYANGAVKNAPDSLKRWSLTERMIPADGPLKHCRFDVATRLGMDFREKSQETFARSFQEELVAVIAGKITEEKGKIIYTELEDVTSGVTEDGWLYKDFPDGNYCLFVYTKRLGAAAGQNDYISMLEKDSVKILLDTVYEPHYRHYREKFGNTIAGFFSDEPGFYNREDGLYAVGEIGQKMPLPWTDDVRDLLKGRMEKEGAKDLTALTGLFHETECSWRMARYTYMDIITRKYQENFSDLIGKWCEEHQVEYIGHVLEDGSFCRSLGAGTGHYFRALHGQHMGGIDVVLNDLLPDRDYGDRVFYHYQLPVLASSIASQNTKMRGRAMCEVFGAYGWSEGLDMMKWMTDHMLVNGINYFVPHAFTDRAFPDSDCPPHFYAQGNNPQYRHMHVLFHYMNRASHLLNGGRAKVPVAVFFPAEGGWTGACHDFGYIGKICLQNQIPYEVICMDTLKNAVVCGGNITVGQAAYQCLIVDKTEVLPGEYLEEFYRLMNQGACVKFVDKIPNAIGTEVENGWDKASEMCLSEEKLPDFLDSYRVCKPASFTKWLRCRRYELEGVTVFLFVNSSMKHLIDTEVEISGMQSVIGYDALRNQLFRSSITENNKLRLKLDKGESLFFFMGEEENLPKLEGIAERKREKAADNGGESIQELYTGVYQISLAPYFCQNDFKELLTTEKLEDMNQQKKDFAGIIRYDLTVKGRKQFINLGECYGAAEVFVNGYSCGSRITYPYKFELGKYMTEGENHIRIEVATTLFEAVKDAFSLERAVEPSGILGPVTFC